MKNQQDSHVSNGSAMTSGTEGALTRRELMGASVLGAAALLGTSATPLTAENTETMAAAARQARRQGGGKRVIDAHVHLWKLPRNQAPMTRLPPPWRLA